MSQEKIRELENIINNEYSNTAGWGLSLSPEDMAKIGQLFLNDGKWNEEQIVSANWLNESSKEHSRWEEKNLLYGYLWWIIDSSEAACAALGDAGNVIYFNKEKNIVVAIASLFVRNPKDILELIKKHIEPLFEN